MGEHQTKPVQLQALDIICSCLHLWLAQVTCSRTTARVDAARSKALLKDPRMSTNDICVVMCLVLLYVYARPIHRDTNIAFVITTAHFRRVSGPSKLVLFLAPNYWWTFGSWGNTSCPDGTPIPHRATIALCPRTGGRYYGLSLNILWI